MKTCKKCGVPKSEDEFYAAKGTRDGRRGECKECNLGAKKAWYQDHREHAIERASAWQRENKDRYNARMRAYRRERTDIARDEHLRRAFGLSLADYERLLEGQDGRCAICSDAPSERRPLHVDHDHETGEIRGLICMRCNNAIGLFRDRIDVLHEAVDYLEMRPSELEELAQQRVRELVGVA